MIWLGNLYSPATVDSVFVVSERTVVRECSAAVFVTSPAGRDDFLP